ncbi:hypothetical protein [Larkinella terrae]|uniref:Uncharacterized protein n=1 Tax=Larkinella terrae TaxID=2025311 RepID=A0A7K0EIG3_9BACT|nr:hypothetical protein [Larkinella terrae]MRS61633.1 hypothetical protein [Larkinella terrae]
MSNGADYGGDVESILNSNLFSLTRNSAVNKHVSIPSLEGKSKYRVYGDGITRPVWIYIYPYQLAAKNAKYKARKQWLFGPLPNDE